MSEVLQTNIFFFITSVAVVVVTILLAAVLVYVLLIVRNVKDITDRLREGSQLIASDFKALRDRLYATGSKLQRLGGFFWDKIFLRRSQKRRKKSDETGNSAV